MNTAGSSSDLAVIVGDRIRALRRERHITQAELARRLGIKPGPMNVMEKGRHVPSGRMLYRLARELEVSVDELFGRRARVAEGASGQGTEVVQEGRDRPVVAEGAVSYGIERATVVPFLPFLDTPGSAAALRVADQLALSFMALEDLCGAMKFAVLPLHVPFAATDGGIEQLVAQVRQHLGITHAIVFDYLELLENAGLRVVFCDLPAGGEGADVASLCAYDRRHGNAIFFVRRTLTPERQLFRLLFELGRIYWHTRRMVGGLLPGEDEPLDEVHAARKFAAFLLMPEVAVRGTAAQLGIASGGWTFELLLRIKHRFGVSAESFCIRLEELGLIENKLAAGFKRRIKDYYAANGRAEPDGSMRRLSYNGRLGDLLLNALGKKGEAGNEAREIAARLAGFGVGMGGGGI